MDRDMRLSAPYDTDSVSAHPECGHRSEPGPWCADCPYEEDCEARLEMARREGED